MIRPVADEPGLFEQVQVRYVTPNGVGRPPESGWSPWEALACDRREERRLRRKLKRRNLGPYGRHRILAVSRYRFRLSPWRHESRYTTIHLKK